jgi:hypothetical protein
VLEERVRCEGLEAKDAIASDDREVEEELELRVHRVDDPGPRLHMSKATTELGAKPERLGKRLKSTRPPTPVTLGSGLVAAESTDLRRRTRRP